MNKETITDYLNLSHSEEKLYLTPKFIQLHPLSGYLAKRSGLMYNLRLMVILLLGSAKILKRIFCR